MSVRAVRNIAAPNYPVATKEYSPQAQDQYTNVLRLFCNSVANAINAPRVMASLYDTTTQTNPVANTAMPITMNTVAALYGVKIGSPSSKVYVSEDGVYNIQFSIQADKTGGGAQPFYIWLRINGIDVPYSASKVVISGPNSEMIPAWNFVQVLKGNDYFELMWSSPDTAMFLPTVAASPPVPAIPSVILTVTWVSNIPV